MIRRFYAEDGESRLLRNADISLQTTSSHVPEWNLGTQSRVNETEDINCWEYRDYQICE
jgi:predicted metal-dependent hydrolase